MFWVGVLTFMERCYVALGLLSPPRLPKRLRLTSRMAWKRSIIVAGAWAIVSAEGMVIAPVPLRLAFHSSRSTKILGASSPRDKCGCH